VQNHTVAQAAFMGFSGTLYTCS